MSKKIFSADKYKYAHERWLLNIYYQNIFRTFLGFDKVFVIYQENKIESFRSYNIILYDKRIYDHPCLVQARTTLQQGQKRKSTALQGYNTPQQK